MSETKWRNSSLSITQVLMISSLDVIGILDFYYFTAEKNLLSRKRPSFCIYILKMSKVTAYLSCVERL